MQVKYPICCGVDVHKSFIVAVIVKDNSPTPDYIKKRFSTFNNQLLEFKSWLISNQCFDICMESTGKYWIPIKNILDESIFNVCVANPKWVRAVKGNKDDNKDAKWIADLFRLGLVRSSYIPCEEIRILREYLRYKFKLTNNRSSEKNRYLNCLTVGNLSVDQVFSDVFGKSSQSIVEYVLNTDYDKFNDASCLALLSKKGNRKASNEDVLNAVKGSNLSSSQKLRISIVKKHMDFISSLIDELNTEINSLVLPFESFISLLQTIPGVSRDSAIIIISEIGVDMNQFDNSRQLCSWAGLTPTNNESAGKKKSVRISRSGIYIKPCLVQVAHAAVKCIDDPYYAIKFKRISKRRGKKRATIAIARMILTACYHIIKTGEAWNPRDLKLVEMPTEVSVKLAKSDLQKSIKVLLSNGVSIDELLTDFKK